MAKNTKKSEEVAAEAAEAAPVEETASEPATDTPAEPAEVVAEVVAEEPQAVADEAPDAAGEPPAADADSEPVADAPAAEADAPVAQEIDEEALRAKVLKPAADARYSATGKRKTSVARVIVTPGDGTFWINGRTIEDYFPRHGARVAVMEPMVLVGAVGAYNVRARIHGGGVQSQAGALRHGISRALADIDPMVRTQLKSKGFLKLDARQVERKKAGLKKARKRPQFSKR